jgi:alpha-L-arabinofuranosidase
MRAAAGHPAPFPLKYIEVGNEDQGARYGARFARFYKAIHAKYPQIEVALDSWIAGIDRQAIDAAGKFEIFDEHAYKPLNWAIENFDSFAQYAREGWKLYIGEFATNTGVGRGNLIAALNDVAYMMSMEKNSDLVHMGSYAPLLENVNKRDWDVNLIHFDSSRLFARASYYAAKLFAEHRPDVNLPAAVKYESADPRPVMGKIGLGTWNTSAEYKDVRVESGGRVLYASDFSEGTAGWQTQRGTWSVQDGAYRQKDNTVAFAYFGEADWKDVTITAKARKLGGSEGFLIVAGTADGRQIRWNVAGWNNRQSAIQAGDAIEGPIARGGVETDRWYDLKVEVRGRTLRCWMDGKLVNEYTLPRVDTVLAIAGKDERTGETVIKVVNSSGEPAKMDLRVPGAGKQAKVWVLSSANPTDENSFEEPMKIAPRESREQAGTAFSHEFPPYSLTVIRI